MTIQQALDLAAEYPLHLLLVFLALPLASWIIGAILGNERIGESPWRYLYSVLVYLACIPGILAAVIVAYSLAFAHKSLLEMNIAVHFLPPLSMAATLFLISRRVGFDKIPGFERLWGLMALIALTFCIILALERTRIWIIFGGSFTALIAAAAAVFAVLQWAAQLTFRRRGDPKPEFPDIPEIKN